MQIVVAIAVLLVFLCIGLIVFFRIMEYHASVARSLNVTPVLKNWIISPHTNI